MYFFKVLFVPEQIPRDESNQQPLVTPSTSSSSSLKTSKDRDAFVLLTDRHSSNDISTLPSPLIQQDTSSMVWSMARQASARPGQAERLSEQSNIKNEFLPITSDENVQQHQNELNRSSKVLRKSVSIDSKHRLDEEISQRFIKSNVELMTDDRVCRIIELSMLCERIRSMFVLCCRILQHIYNQRIIIGYCHRLR
jgi:hypothetical protein